LINIVSLVIFYIISIITIYLAALSIAARFYRKKQFQASDTYRKIAILIPAFKEDKIILSTVEHCLNQNYPKESFSVFVGAHFLKKATINELKSRKVYVIDVNEPVGSKALSLQKIFQNIDEKFEIALILDADNIIPKDCLFRINEVFESGYKGVQLHRTAKNLNTPIAILDAISEEINNTLFRKGNRSLNLSASTIGSGMAFSFTSLRKTYFKPGIIDNPACDREVEFDQLNERVKIEYLDDVNVLDEKVQDLSTFRNQRTRWNESQIWHVRRYLTGLKRKNISFDHINKFIQNLVPSRILLMAVLFFILVIEILLTLFSKFTIDPGLTYWIILFGIYHLVLLSAIPVRFFTRRYLHIFLYVPLLAWNYLIAVTRIRTGKKEFVHTPKSID
jgi:cellulose synthase/poly-beta-1,6-N-acetylglucosamine synthase-like glycosyltransferase